MKLLIITQKVDKNDPILGFFHRWIQEFAQHFDLVTVICLEEGVHELQSCDYGSVRFARGLPANVKVLSLGKEKKVSRATYLSRFYSYIWKERKNYDVVFVHMNQEYILLGGLFWKLFGKKIYMWRNHHVGSFLTDIAAGFCTKVFCTSKYSYTAKYSKTVFMPVGVDIEYFKPQQNIERRKGSILFLARFSPTKRPDLLIEALKNVADSGIEYTASIYGDPIESDVEYYESIKARVLKYRLEQRVTFYKGLPNYETPKIYSAHEIFVNLSSSGMYDKTIFEAMACSCLIIASNDNLRGRISDDFVFKQGDLKELTKKLEKLLDYSVGQKQVAVQELRKFTESHSLKNLANRLFKKII